MKEKEYILNSIFAICAIITFYWTSVTITSFVIFSVISFIWFIYLPADCDLLLLFCTKFGKNIESLEGKVIWITGASTGIGEGIANQLARAKVKLVLSARSEDKLQIVKSSCIQKGILSSDDILIIPFDMTDYSKHESALSTILQRFGKLDVLINNAGRSQRAEWEHIELEVDRAIFELNVFSLIALSRHVVKYFKTIGKGHIAVMSSVAGKFGVPLSSSYNGSKFALSGYFEGLRSEMGSKGITVTMLHPGAVDSNLMAGCLTERLGGDRPQARTGKMMSSDRCGELTAIAISNQLSEVWMCANPVLLLVYAAQYCPVLLLSFMNKFDFTAITTKLRDGKDTRAKKD